MRKTLACGLVLLSGMSHALTTQTFQENGDVSIHLSDSNANRLVVKGDKITQVHFPEGALGVQNEADGSLYVTLLVDKAFTLFVSTEGGRHFSATINPEDALGQTVQFVPKTPVVAVKKPVVTSPYHAYEVRELMQEMVTNKTPEGYVKKKRYGKITRYQNGLKVTPALSYVGESLNGEVFTIYHGGRAPITLSESWFSSQGTAAVKLTSKTLMPGEHATIYKVVRHA
ncbi:MAG: type-F conjugative transfer system secretin TraK [Legionellaceae bacterium]|nr:type-F conjugative transfer system secretin TraK [Legionellaceae bacterium]